MGRPAYKKQPLPGDYSIRGNLSTVAAAQSEKTGRSGGESRANLIAGLLSGAWRPEAAPPEISAGQLAEVAPLLLGSGSGSFGWCRVRHSPLASSPAGLQLQQAYRHHTLEAALHERDIQEIFTLFRSRGIEPVLVKGWAIARLYPEKGMRPYEDIDLVVRKEQYIAALDAIRNQGDRQYFFDLHRGFKTLDHCEEDDLIGRSRLIKLGEVEVRVLALEDHLRVLCLHLLHHGAFRPLWLCDIGMAVESRPPDFDWDRCLGGNKRVADWIACTIGLAHRLLGARVEDTPVAHRAGNLPVWLIRSVLKQWENPLPKAHGVARHRAPMMNYLRRPAGVLEDLRNRWPTPLEATVNLRGPLNELPRLPFQLADCAARAAKFLVQVPNALRGIIQ